MSEPYQTQDYDIRTTPHIYLISEVRPKSVSKCFLSNPINNNSHDSGQNVLTTGPSHSGSSSPQRNRMVEDDMRLPIFNGNGLEDPKQHWFLCEYF